MEFCEFSLSLIKQSFQVVDNFDVNLINVNKLEIDTINA